ncbi:MAG: hypothetical protein K6G91_01620 [Kiritimatiellae bacterium]|nr:hypothetical protein [Kiritimatiellia bacterium]
MAAACGWRKMAKRAFTLIELMAIVAIMAAMVTVGVVSIGASRSATRVFAAGRDVMAMVRRARSLALVTQQPVVVSYSNGTVEEEPCASVEIQAKKLFSSSKRQERVYNLAGEVVVEPEPADVAGQEGETLEDVLSPESIPADVVKGLKIKVLDESDELRLPENETRRSKISIFSTADNVSRTLTSDSSQPDDASAAEDAADDGPFRVAFAANGTVNPPHRIWIYRAESSPEKGVCIHVDRFGEPKCDDIEE